MTEQVGIALVRKLLLIKILSFISETVYVMSYLSTLCHFEHGHVGLVGAKSLFLYWHILNELFDYKPEKIHFPFPYSARRRILFPQLSSPTEFPTLQRNTDGQKVEIEQKATTTAMHFVK